MKLLLDTHIWLWGLLEPERLRRAVARRLEDPQNELWLSPLSVWEFVLLAERGRLAGVTEPSTWLDWAFRAAPLRDAPLNRQVAQASQAVALPHRDPVDRLLVATASAHGLTLVTADSRLTGTKHCRILANR